MDDFACDILLTDAVGAAAGEIVRSLSSKGLSVLVFDAASARKDECAFVRELKKFCSFSRPRMIMPLFFPEVLARHASEFPGIVIPIASANVLTQLDNKLSASKFAASLGIPLPKTIYVQDLSNSDASAFGLIYKQMLYAGLDFPLVFKRASSQGGDSVYFPRNAQALENLLRTSSEAIISEFVPGYDICVDALKWGDFFYAAAYRVLEPSGKGVSTLRESVDCPQAIALTRTLLDAVDYRGACGVDFRLREEGNSSDVSPYLPLSAGSSLSLCSGELLFLECNPRFSGGIASAIASGFDLPYLLYRLASGDTLSPSDIHFTPGIRTGKSIY